MYVRLGIRGRNPGVRMSVIGGYRGVTGLEIGHWGIPGCVWRAHRRPLTGYSCRGTSGSRGIPRWTGIDSFESDENEQGNILRIQRIEI